MQTFLDAISEELGADFNIPVAFGMDGKKDAALDQNIIKATKLEEKAK